MSTEQTRTVALELAVDLAAAETETLLQRVVAATVLERARLFDAYIVGTGVPAVPNGAGFDVVVFDEAHADAQDTERRVTPADLYARGRMSR